MITLIYLIFCSLITIQGPEIQEIEFGHGGGFTGALEAYKLNRKGELYKINSFNERQALLKTIDLETTSKIFDIVKNNNLTRIKVNKPGNVYKYIGFNLEGSKLKLVWSGKSDYNKLNLLYSDLKALYLTKEKE